jgi:dimeric dUTPase (all-alpha-NTP-PPase superfamily)
MKFKELFKMQRELDTFIEETQNITYDVFQEKGLALLVELSELANETRCFKFWSTKGPSDRSVILEEFVDSIHFILSLGNMRGFSMDAWPEVKEKAELTPLFIETTVAATTFIGAPTKEAYHRLWHLYGKLAYNLGFTVEDILDAYLAKNEKNYERQRSGY